MKSPDPDHPSAAVVIGLGLMGCDIAAIFLAAGYQVTAVEPNAAAWPGVSEFRGLFCRSEANAALHRNWSL